MKLILMIAYFAFGIIQFAAVWNGTEHFFDVESSIGSVISFFVSLLLSYIPILGSGMGVYGAVNVWDWSLAKSLLLFFWYVPLMILVIGVALVADRR